MLQDEVENEVLPNLFNSFYTSKYVSRYILSIKNFFIKNDNLQIDLCKEYIIFRNVLIDIYLSAVSPNEYYDGSESKAKLFLKKNKMKNSDNTNENETPKLMAMSQAFLTTKDSEQRFKTNKKQPNYYQGISEDFLRAIYNSVHSKCSCFDFIYLNSSSAWLRKQKSFI